MDGTPLVPFTPRTVTDKARILAAVHAVRESGFALAFEETEPDASGAAVAIRDHSGAIRAALVVAGPSSRFDKAAIAAGVPVMQRLAEDVSRQLGYQSPGGTG